MTAAANAAAATVAATSWLCDGAREPLAALAVAAATTPAAVATAYALVGAMTAAKSRAGAITAEVQTAAPTEEATAVLAATMAGAKVLGSFSTTEEPAT